MSEFTPIASTVGGLLIGAAAVLMLAFNGRIAGISGIAGGLFGARASGKSWRLAFLAGLFGGGLLTRLAMPEAFGTGSPLALPWLVVAGLLVGFGTRLGGGCTSGHGVCGMSRLSPRSIAATVVFMALGVATVFVVRHVIGGH